MNAIFLRRSSGALVLLLALLSTLLTLSPAEAQSPAVEPTATSVAPVAKKALAARKKVSVTLSPKGEAYPKGSTVTFTSGLSYGKKGSTARLQRLGATSWKTVKSVKLKKTGKQAAKFSKVPVLRGRWEYRVVTSATGSYLGGNSYASSKYRAALHKVSCDTYYYKKKPKTGISTYFSNPGAYSESKRSKRTQTLSVNTARFICSAAKGSTVRVAMWHIDDDALYSSPPNQSNRILAALDYVARYRGVNVSLVVDRRTGKKTTTTNWLKQISRNKYYTCQLACLSDRGLIYTSSDTKQYYGDQHSKFITISKTSGGEKALLTSSSNWSFWQLRDYWNSVMVSWNNTTLNDSMSRRFDDMVLSARRSAATKPAWKESLLRNNTTLGWVPAKANEIGGSVAVSYSPLNAALPDPLFSRLNNYTCVKDQSVVRMSMLFFSGTTGIEAAKSLGKLKTAGCKVEVLMSKPITSGASILTDRASFDALRRELGISAGKTSGVLKCVKFMHSKNVIVDATLKGAREKTVWTGSRNMNSAGTFDSDETTIRLTGSSSILGKYTADFLRAQRAGVSCPSTWDKFKVMK